MRARLAAMAVLLIAALYVVAARRLPVGIDNDDAANVLLAQSLRHGSYSFPGGLGAPEEYVPAFPLLLVVPAWLVEPHWNMLRAIPLFFTALCLLLTWRLARRFLSAEAAAAAVLLTALNPAFVCFGGLLMPYLPYLALSLALIDGAASGEDRASFWRLTAGAALAPLLRPQGAVLIGCLALALWHRRGLRRGLAFLALALLPAIAWTLRNHFRAASSRDYVDTWRMNIAAVGKTPLLERVSHLLSLIGFAFLHMGPLAVQIAFGAAALALALYGVLALLRKRDDPRLFVMACYMAGLVCLHITWKWFDARYLIPFLPLLWIAVIAAATRLCRKNRALQGLLLAVSIALALPPDIAFARRGLRGPGEFQPETMAWIRANVPATARLQSMLDYSVALLTGRECAQQTPFRLVDQAVAQARRDRVDYMHVLIPPPDEEFVVTEFPPGYQTAFARILGARPDVTQAYRNLDEGSFVFRLDRP